MRPQKGISGNNNHLEEKREQSAKRGAREQRGVAEPEEDINAPGDPKQSLHPIPTRFEIERRSYELVVAVALSNLATLVEEE